MTLGRDGWRFLVGELRGRPRALVRLAAWSAVEVAPAGVSGVLVARAIDEGFLRQDAATGFRWLGALAAAMVLGAFGARRSVGALADVVEPVRDAVVRAVVAGSIGRAVAGVDRADTAAVARLTGQTEVVRQVTASLLMTVRLFAFTLVATLAGLLALAPVITLLVLPPVLLALGLFWRLLLGTAPRARAAVLAGERAAEAIGELAAGVRDVVACGAERRAADAAGAAIGDQAAAERALARIGATRILVVALGTQLPLVAVLVAAPWLVDGSLATPGQVVGAVTYLTTSLQPALTALVQGVGSLGVQLGVVLQRITETARVPVAPAPAHPREPAGSRLVLRGLTFAYGPGADPVVRDLDLVLEPGDHLAVVGASGIGKSTLANLLTGLLAPGAGTVALGGVPLDEVDPAGLRRDVALIPQEAYVFTGTVRENLGYLRPDGTAPAADLDATCAALALAPLVRRLGGYDAEVAPEALSAGERQLLALARVHLSPAAVVVLDEATCFLDPVAEAVVERAFAARPGTLVVVAHRISSALRADRVLLMDGATPAVGRHDDLLAGVPRYADLVGAWDAAPVLARS